MYLYDLSTAARQLYGMLSDGEIDEQTFHDTLEAIGTDERLESCCKIIRQSEADLAGIKKEILSLQKKKQSAENSIERMKSAVLDFLDSAGLLKAKAGVFSVSKRTSKAVSVLDEDIIPEEFWEAQKPKLSKTKIKDAINAGLSVPGAEIVTNVNIVIK